MEIKPILLHGYVKKNKLFLTNFKNYESPHHASPPNCQYVFFFLKKEAYNILSFFFFFFVKQPLFFSIIFVFC